MTVAPLCTWLKMGPSQLDTVARAMWHFCCAYCVHCIALLVCLMNRINQLILLFLGKLKLNSQAKLDLQSKVSESVFFLLY